MAPVPPGPDPMIAAPTRRTWLRATAAAVAFLVLLCVRCVSAPTPSATDSIEVCGQHFPIGTRVVSWREPDGYDAHQRGKHFQTEDPPDGKLRYTPLRGGLDEAMQARAEASGMTLDDLRQVVHQFVLHYDNCGTSRQCFKVLQDVRYLSVHFLLDVDGTIYQTLDLSENAWHATYANDFSIGVEIAHPGAFPQPMNATMRPWYERDAEGWHMKTPAWMTETGIRTPGFVARPARPDIVSGIVQHRTYYMLDYTPQQYEALAHLCAGLARVFPRIHLEVPRNPDGTVIDHALPEADLRAFDGIVGHFHVQKNKEDPGPALQWDRLLQLARAL